MIADDGAYYIGWCKDDMKHGWGKYVSNKGTYEGLFKNDQYLEDQNDVDQFSEEPYIITKAFLERDYIIKW